MNNENYYFPFGEVLHRLEQEDKTPKKVFVLGVYASAVHARWRNGNKTICQALAVASEPRIFWDGNEEEAKAIIDRIRIPKELGTLEPAGGHWNGPSAKVLDENILKPLEYTRKNAWLCDLLPETRLNPSQQKALQRSYEPEREKFHLNCVTIPSRPATFCDQKRCKEILLELEQSKADLLVLLGDIPIKQFLNRVANVEYTSLQDYVDKYKYGNCSETVVGNRKIKVLPLAHPRQIGGLGPHSKKWAQEHSVWDNNMRQKACL
jgi:uracil-DNA glycosylase